jgi:hypothetical protein
MKNVFQQFGILPPQYSSGEFELRLRCLVRYFRAVLKELKSTTGLPWKQRFRAWKLGFSSEAWLLYSLADNDPQHYFNDISTRLGMYKINGFSNPIIDNKLVFSRLASAHGIPHPEVVSTIIDGRIFEEGKAVEPDRMKALNRSLDDHPHQVFRPTWAGGGQGIFFLDRNQDTLKLNGVEVALGEVSTLVSGLDRYVSTAFEIQARYANTIFPHSCNTLRILTLWDYDKDIPFIAATVHRFGTSRSTPLDSWHGGQGGICASVNPVTSMLGQAVMATENLDLIWCSSHPETGEQIEGVVIPHLADCLQGVLAAASHFPYCPLIGWDVAVTENGFSIIEPNPLPSFRVWQIHEPLLINDRARQFFRHWNMAV